MVIFVNFLVSYLFVSYIYIYIYFFLFYSIIGQVKKCNLSGLYKGLYCTVHYLEPLDCEGEGEEDAECQADVAGALHDHVHTYTRDGQL